MNDDRTLERAARSWLEGGPTRAPDRAVEAALSRIDIPSQERALRLRWSLPAMHPMVRLAGAAIVAVLVVGLAVYALRPTANVGPAPTPSPTAVPSPSASHAAPSYHAPSPVVFPSAWPVPPGDPLPANLIGRTYRPDPPEIQGTQENVLTLRAADDPHCVGLYGGASTCFTILWTPNGPRHIDDPAVRGSARIVDGNLVLGIEWAPNDQSCEGEFGTFAIQDGGGTLLSTTLICGYGVFRGL